MSSLLEQSVEDIAFLKGATLKSIKERKAEDAYDMDCLQLVFTLANPIQLELDPGKQILAKEVTFEVWQDPEGNGPGFLSLVGGK